MRILAIDPGTKCGLCLGDVAPLQAIAYGQWHISKYVTEPFYVAGGLYKLIYNFTRDRRPRIIVAEQPVVNRLQGPGNPALLQAMRMQGAIIAFAMVHDIHVKFVHVATWRKHFCGVASTGKRQRGVRRTAQELAAVRKANKLMVRDRCVELGYLPSDSKDFETADAIGIWYYAMETYGGGNARGRTHGTL